MKRLGLGLALAALTACASEQERQAKLSLACMVRTCICQSATLTAKPRPVLWRDNGEAYCPDGFRLRNTEKKKGFKSFYGG